MTRSRAAACEASRAGAHLRFARPYRGAHRVALGFELATGERVRHLVGADGPKSAVAAEFGLGRNRKFLLGVEAEYECVTGVDPERLHCFLDSELAPATSAGSFPGSADACNWVLRAASPGSPISPPSSASSRQSAILARRAK